VQVAQEQAEKDKLSQENKLWRPAFAKPARITSTDGSVAPTQDW